MIEKKMCALLRQTWYETAKANMKPEDRLRFYEACFEYEFNNVAPSDDLPFAARLLFDMVKSDLDSDKVRATERAERNRRNGMLGGRPKGNQTQQESQNPEKPSGLNGLHIQNSTEQNTTKQNNLSSDFENEDTHNFFDICLNFFERGCSDAVEEGTKFWNYYDALGWKTSNGGEIVNRCALAKAWRLKDCSAALIKSRKKYAKMLHNIHPVEMELLDQYDGLKVDDKKKTATMLVRGTEIVTILESKYLDALKQFVPTDDDGKRYTLTYSQLD